MEAIKATRLSPSRPLPTDAWPSTTDPSAVSPVNGNAIYVYEKTEVSSAWAGGGYHWKRGLDLLIAGALLVVLAIPLLVVAALIKLTSRGPVLYSQYRVGLHGRIFRMYKFRSMRQNAEAQTGPIWATENDPRCTRLGSFLRRTSIDELPQLLNVLRGEMSIVGPRPERPYFVRQFSKQYRDFEGRLLVPPGVTGWAQIHGWRGNTSLTARLEHDLYYVRKWSLWLDLYILLLTPSHVLVGKNAH
jgi:undecaprenyl-phosphate glucose phosphotransferase